LLACAFGAVTALGVEAARRVEAGRGGGRAGRR
jgi:predicted outer membrane lipoprotein